MHAQQPLETHDAGPRGAASFRHAGTVKPGEHFVRTESPHEVLVPLSYGGAECEGGDRLWAVVVAVNDRTAGFVPGQLISVRREALVRVVRELRAPVFALEA